MHEVRAREEFGGAKMWTLLVGGVSTGSAPRAVAENYRLAVQRELDRIFHGNVNIRFERFEELPDLPSAAPGDRRGLFTINAAIRFNEKTTTSREEAP